MPLWDKALCAKRAKKSSAGVHMCAVHRCTSTLTACSLKKCPQSAHKQILQSNMVTIKSRHFEAVRTDNTIWRACTHQRVHHVGCAVRSNFLVRWSTAASGVDSQMLCTQFCRQNKRGWANGHTLTRLPPWFAFGLAPKFRQQKPQLNAGAAQKQMSHEEKVEAWQGT